MNETKNCEKCGSVYPRNTQYSQKQWDKSRYCSRECSSRKFEKQNPMDGFFSHVSIDPSTHCWNWIGARDATGYGFFGGIRAHRHMWMNGIGDIPNGLWVLHRCDNRSCVNPAHLFLGTLQDNVDDMWMKGRGNPRVGESNHLAKLTEADVLAIRDDPRLQEDIARDYGIVQTTVSAIKTKRTWAHVKSEVFRAGDTMGGVVVTAITSYPKG